MKKCLFAQWLLLVAVMVTACSEKEEDFSNVPGATEYTWSATESATAEGGNMSFSFTALDDWTASFSETTTATKSSSWVTLSPSTGSKGKVTLTVKVDKNEEASARKGVVNIVFDKYKIVSFGVQQEAGEPEVTPPVAGKTDMNATVDKFLAKYYLWNDEYQGMERDLNIPYVSSSDNFLNTTLLSMTTNTLDKKWYESTNSYLLYSYLLQNEKKSSTRSVQTAGVDHGIEKDDPISSYGFSRIMGVYLTDKSGTPTGEYAFVVCAVYPGSAATAFDLNRGTIIYKVDGKSINNSNLDATYWELLYPSKSQVQVTIVADGAEKTLTLMPSKIDPSPILYSDVIEHEGHKVGYLVYSGFDAAYDDELLTTIKSLKDGGATDLILDFRYNGGGHVVSSMMLSACVAGSVVKDKVFYYQRFNKTRMDDVEGMKKAGYNYDATAGYYYENFPFDDYYGVNLADYALSMPRLYVLTSSSTASASELLVNSLRGIDFPVTLIGGKTNGKNVGMEVTEFDSGNYSYELAPISFQYYNAKSKTIPSDGIDVDYEVDEWNNGLIDFGQVDEPMLAKALQLITGATESKATTRAASTITMKPMPVQPQQPVQPRRQGALMLLPQSAE